MVGTGWVIATLLGSAGQVVRNIAQSKLTSEIGTLGATQVRFVFGLPFAVLFLILALIPAGTRPPLPGPQAVAMTAAGAIAQIGGTALMLKVMQTRSFAVTTAWLKTEPMLIALGGAVILGDRLSLPALAAIVIATGGVMLTAFKPGIGRAVLSEGGAAANGLLAAALFGAAAVGFRGGILALGAGDFVLRASTTLVLSLFIQSLVLMIWMLFFDRSALIGSLRVWHGSLGAGFVGALASQFWFIGFALTSAANVRTLALVEVIFAQGVGRFVLGQTITGRQFLGMVVIVLGVALLLRTEI